MLLVLSAAFFQGTFLVPMNRTRTWQWEHTWAVFCLFGMLILNWLAAILLVPNLFSNYARLSSSDLMTLILFGVGWGLGAILFGLGMDKLGLALGYPLIMGLTASTGAMFPLLFFSHGAIATRRGVMVTVGAVIAIFGIILCSVAASRKKPGLKSNSGASLRAGLIIAVAAGLLCGLPNVGMVFGLKALRAAGVSGISAGNALWSMFFTSGGIVNIAYCLALMFRRNNLGLLKTTGSAHNWGLGFGMALMWIASFYLYGFGASRMGIWGPIAGWPILIAGSIGIGVLWGFRNGEWEGAPQTAIRILHAGLLTIIAAVAVLAYTNAI